MKKAKLWNGLSRSEKIKHIFDYLESMRNSQAVCRVCTEEGDHGNEDGFGVEPDMWQAHCLILKGR